MDETQTPPKPEAKSKVPYFILAGVIIHEAQWHGIASEFKALKARPDFNVRGEVKWRYFGPTNTDKENSVLHLDVNARHAFRDAMYAILVRRKAVKIVCCVTDTKAAYDLPYVKDQEDLYHYTYKAVSERFQYFLQDMERTVGERQLGLMVADHRGKPQDEGLRLRHHALVDENTPVFSTYSNYIETLFLTPSHHSVGIQFADMVAGAIGRHFNSRDSRYFIPLDSAFRRSPAGKVEGFGIVHFPRKK